MTSSKSLLQSAGMLIYDLRFGKQSNIPSCCIFAFTFFNWSIFLYNRRDRGIFKKLYELKTEGANYAECPICLLRKREPNKIAHCGYVDMGIKGFKIDHPFFFSGCYDKFSEKKWWIKFNGSDGKSRNDMMATKIMEAMFKKEEENDR